MKRLLVLVGCVVLLSGLGIWFFSSSGSQRKIRNVLIISIDTCRADHLSCYGYQRKTTPNIDAIAEEGILFENVITPLPLTLPAHGSMLTGTGPLYHGVHNNIDYRLGQSNVTVAEILKDNGFTTGGIVSAFVLDSQFGLNQGFDYYNDRFDEKLNSVGINERRGEETTRHTLEWLEEHRCEPFFLFLHYFDPHMLYEPPEPFASKFIGNPYAGEIAYTDHCIGQVIGKLKELDLYDSTLLVITSDHGESLGEHGENTHGYFIYQSTLKVPLVFKLPGGPKGVRIVDTVGLIDIVPTICGRLKVSVPAQIQGRDLSRYFSQKNYSAEERYIYCESLLPTKYQCNSLLGVVNDRFKYIQTTRPELYDLVEDPHESNNLAAKEGSRVRALHNRLQHILERTVRKAESDSKMQLDEQARRRLESLGYITSNIDESFEFDQSKDDAKDVIDFHNATLTVGLLILQKKYALAKSLCEKLLVQRPNTSEIYLDMGKIAMEQKGFAEAASYLNKAIELDPCHIGAHNNLGLVLIQLSENNEAIKHFKEALRLDPERPEVLNNLGNVLVREKKYDQAIEHFNKALEIDPKLLQTHRNLGNVFALSGEIEMAVRHWSEAVRLDSNQPTVWNKLAETLYVQDRINEAIRYWKQALSFQPDLPRVLNNLAWVMATHRDENFRDPLQAVQLAESACDLSKFEDPEFLDTLSAAYAATGKFNEAIETAEKALKLYLDLELAQKADDVRNRLELFKKGQPYLEEP